MTLLVTIFAAVVCTALWYKDAPKDEWKLSILCYMYWGASIMWFVDAIFEYAELREKFFSPEPAQVLNDFILGLSVVALGLVVWIVVLLWKDPRQIRKTKSAKG